MDGGPASLPPGADLLYLNGRPLLREPLAARRAALHASLEPVHGAFRFAEFSARGGRGVCVCGLGLFFGPRAKADFFDSSQCLWAF